MPPRKSTPPKKVATQKKKPSDIYPIVQAWSRHTELSRCSQQKLIEKCRKKLDNPAIRPRDVQRAVDLCKKRQISKKSRAIEVKKRLRLVDLPLRVGKLPQSKRARLGCAGKLLWDQLERKEKRAVSLQTVQRTIRPKRDAVRAEKHRNWVKNFLVRDCSKLKNPGNHAPPRRSQ